MIFICGWCRRIYFNRKDAENCICVRKAISDGYSVGIVKVC